MPNRIIKESIRTSTTLAQISAHAERLFYRLLTTTDDYGLFMADSSIIKGSCFPLHSGVDTGSIEIWLKELSENNIIQLYSAGERKYGKFTTFMEHNRLRAKTPKYPLPEDARCHMTARDNTCQHMSVYSESESESEKNNIRNVKSRDLTTATTTTDKSKQSAAQEVLPGTNKQQLHPDRVAALDMAQLHRKLTLERNPEHPCSSKHWKENTWAKEYMEIHTSGRDGGINWPEIRLVITYAIKSHEDWPDGGGWHNMPGPKSFLRSWSVLKQKANKHKAEQKRNKVKWL